MTRFLRSSPERALAAFLLAGALVGGAMPAGAQPEGRDAGTQAAREVLKDPRYQREMPPHPEPRDVEDAGDREFTGGGSGGGAGQVALPVIGAGAAIGKVVFIILIAVVVLLLAGWLGQAVLRRRRRDETVEVAPEGEGAAVREREPTFDEETRLAAEGRYAEAVHALLLAAIRHFAERSRVAIQPSRTSRELVRLLPLGGEAREAFSDLVRTVELSLFGGAPVGQEEYERSLARFRDLTRRAAV